VLARPQVLEVKLLNRLSNQLNDVIFAAPQTSVREPVVILDEVRRPATISATAKTEIEAQRAQEDGLVIRHSHFFSFMLRGAGASSTSNAANVLELVVPPCNSGS